MLVGTDRCPKGVERGTKLHRSVLTNTRREGGKQLVSYILRELHKMHEMHSTQEKGGQPKPSSPVMKPPPPKRGSWLSHWWDAHRSIVNRFSSYLLSDLSNPCFVDFARFKCVELGVDSIRQVFLDALQGCIKCLGHCLYLCIHNIRRVLRPTKYRRLSTLAQVKS